MNELLGERPVAKALGIGTGETITSGILLRPPSGIDFFDQAHQAPVVGVEAVGGFAFHQSLHQLGAVVPTEEREHDCEQAQDYRSNRDVQAEQSKGSRSQGSQ